MFLIKCPYCGERDQSEFSCGGEAHIVRPENPPDLTDDQWADYLFMRKNIKGVQFERWNHSNGCRRWFNVVRNTSTDEILKLIEDVDNYHIIFDSIKASKKNVNDIVHIFFDFPMLLGELTEKQKEIFRTYEI